jgi:hypothetical protein
MHGYGGDAAATSNGRKAPDRGDATPSKPKVMRHRLSGRSIYQDLPPSRSWPVGGVSPIDCRRFEPPQAAAFLYHGTRQIAEKDRTRGTRRLEATRNARLRSRCSASRSREAQFP